MFAVIESLKRTNGSGVTEFADQFDLTKSTVHRHLVSLEAVDDIELRLVYG
ncbi:helix-turn-helix domain-containing protein [Natrinema soli]|uniref:Helix-turn-helix domain-containing protein n=1 Tax=Natrinema soli TaxID=1930624 RepID=A0ABD5SSH6_9EURY|nr:helix-turn-helix domain-containing protein [Natrinema soli]